MFQLLLLGDPILLDGGGDAVAVWRPAIALMALAASAQPGSVTRGRAAGLLWPDMEDATARRALRQVLFRMRHDIGELLLVDRTSIAVNAETLRIDVVELERALGARDAAAAADLYRGDFLAGFALSGSTAFEQWTDGRRERLRVQLAEVLDNRVIAATAAGQWDEALRLAQRRLDIDPLSEHAAARVVALLYQCGDHARALSVCADVTTRFTAQLGRSPGGELAAIAERIRRAPATSRGAETAPGSSVMAASAGAEHFRLPLVGRAAELEQLMQRWTLGAGGTRQVIVLGGEEGVGKTRLAADFSRWAAAHGATTLWSQAYEIERQIPYATLAGALREALHAPGLAGIDERTPAEVGRIVPGFTQRFAGSLSSGEPAVINTGRLRVLEAVRDVIDSLAYEAPVLLVVDDVQWADDASLAALNYICRTLPHSRLLLLLTARTAELTHTDGAMRLLHGLIREPGDSLCRIEVRPLDRTAIRSVLLGLGAVESGIDEEAGALLRETGGNALFLTELLRGGRPWSHDPTIQTSLPHHITRDGGDTAAHSAPVDSDTADQVARSDSAGSVGRDRLSALAADRLLRLPDGARRLLETAAVLGRQFPLRLAAALAGLDAASAAESADLLVRRGLLRQVEYGYDFAHGLLRREVVASVGATRITELHAAIYAQLEPAAAANPDEVGAARANALAHHAARAGLSRAAHRWYLHAADMAIRLYAGAEAESALLSALGHALDADTVRATQLQLGQLAWVRSEYAEASRAYGRALELCDDPAERLRLRIRMLDAGLRDGVLRVADADELAPQLLEEAATAGPAPLRDLLIALAAAFDSAGRSGEAGACAARAVDAARAAAEPAPLVRALLLLSRLTALPGETELPLACLREAKEIAHAHRLERERLDTMIELSTELSRIGRWDDAVAELRAALGIARHCRELGAEIVAAINLSDLLVRRGEWEAAEAMLDRGDSIAARQDFPHADAALRLNRALLAWLRGDNADAVAAATRGSAARAAETGLRAVERAAHALVVLSRLEGDDVAGALAHARRLESVAWATHANWAGDQELAVVASSRLDRARGDVDHAIARIEGALADAGSACGSAVLRLELSHAMAPRDAPRARALRKAALDTLDRLGARPLACRLDVARRDDLRGSSSTS